MPLPIIVGFGGRIAGSVVGRTVAQAALSRLASGKGISLRFVGLKAYQARMKVANRRFKKEMRKRLRRAAGFVVKAARRNIRSQLQRRSNNLHRSIRAVVRVRRNKVDAMVLPSNKKKFFPAPQIAPQNERGGRVLRRRNRSGSKKPRKEHFATFQPRPFLEPAVRSTRNQVRREIGRTFNFV